MYTGRSAGLFAARTCSMNFCRWRRKRSRESCPCRARTITSEREPGEKGVRRRGKRERAERVVCRCSPERSDLQHGDVDAVRQCHGGFHVPRAQQLFHLRNKAGSRYAVSRRYCVAPDRGGGEEPGYTWRVVDDAAHAAAASCT